MFILQIGGWFIFSCVFMSFIEHQIHSRLMHTRSLPRFKKTFEAHAITHHKNHYGQVFCDQPVPPGEDKEIRLTVRKAPIKALPVAVVIALFSWPGAIILMLTVTLHHWVWNTIHLEMHKPESASLAGGRFTNFWRATIGCTTGTRTKTTTWCFRLPTTFLAQAPMPPLPIESKWHS